ncbi:hypothetical protein ACEQ8H_000985 [Pleosporales sp. CAS-2024a]
MRPRSTPSSTSSSFSPSHSLFPRSSPARLAPSRPYSSSSGSSRISSNFHVLYGLMGVNLAVFSYGMYAKMQAQQGFQGPYVHFLRHMTCNATDVLRNGAYYTLVTSNFTHLDLWHLAANMFTFYYLGQFLAYSPRIAPAQFLTIALGAGVTGSVSWLCQRYYRTGGAQLDYGRSVGFSGALMGVTSVAACLAPRAEVALYGIVPVPLWGLVLGYAIYDGYYLNDSSSRVAHSGHMGGMAFGVAYYFLRLRGMKF